MAMNNVKVQTDLNDHLGFFCEKCKNYLIVKKVKTEKSEIGKKLTFIHVYCSKCNTKTYIKFYWETEFISFKSPFKN